MSELVIKPVGIVKNNTKNEVLKYSKKDISLNLNSAINQGSDLINSQIIIKEEFLDCLDGIDDFSHLNILFWTHKVPENARYLKKVHPAGLKKMPIKGIFATRSPVRPNPICKTTVKLIERKGNTLLVEGLDAIDNTPVIDIKPHLPFYDSPIDVEIADWMYELMKNLKHLTKNSNKNPRSNPYSYDIRSHPCLKPLEQE